MRAYRDATVEDPMMKPGKYRSSHSMAIAEARASLSDPSRPFTPAEPRGLFRKTTELAGRSAVASSGGVGYGGGAYGADANSSGSSRPSSSFRIGSSQFVNAGPVAPTLRPTSCVGGSEVLQLDAGVAGMGIDDDDAGLGPPPASEPKENVVPGEQQRWWCEVEELLAELRPGASLEALLATADALWEKLKPPAAGAEGPAGCMPPAANELARRRKALLGSAGALMDRREAPLLLRLCRLILGAVGEGSAHLGACKLLFKLSKAEANDRRFRELGLLQLLLAVLAPAAGAASEALLFAAGALKNVSAEPSNQKALVSLGAVGAFGTALRAQTDRLLRAPQTAGVKDAISVKPVHLLVQLTATLRNIAVSGSSRKQFVSTGCVDELCSLLRAVPHHAELCLNVSRVVAKLSLHEDVRARIDADPSHLDALLQGLNLHTNDRPLLVRLCFILGNLSAAHSGNRETIARLALPLLLRLLQEHTDEAVAAAEGGGAPPGGEGEGGEGGEGGRRAEGGEGEGGDAAERIDVLVKLIRLLAHLAISPKIGEAIAAAPETAALLTVLQTLTADGAHEELQLNAVSAVTNLSYYVVGSSVLLSQHEQLCNALVPVLVAPNAEGMIEASRALGNLSRVPEARATICRVRVHEALLLLLEHTNSQVAEAACGALINLAADAPTRAALLDCGGATRLSDMLTHLMATGCSPPPPPPPPQRGERGSGSRAEGGLQPSDVGAALLGVKTLCNLCCGCSTCPIPPDASAELEGLLGGGTPIGWRSIPEASPLLAEWPQAAQLLLQLLSQLPSATEVRYGEEEEYEADDLQEIHAPSDGTW